MSSILGFVRYPIDSFQICSFAQVFATYWRHRVSSEKYLGSPKLVSLVGRE